MALRGEPGKGGLGGGGPGKAGRGGMVRVEEER